MSNFFSSVQHTRPRTSTFNPTHKWKLTTKAGLLKPFLYEDAVPGSRFKLKSAAVIRVAPMIAPLMHDVNFYMHYWFIPYRLLWPNWPRFIKGHSDTPTNTPEPAFPTVDIGGVEPGTMADAFGVGRVDNDNKVLSAFPFSAYEFVWKECYRDQNLQNDDWLPLMDGDNTDNFNHLFLRERAWEHDYFTSVLPFAQKGDPIRMPLGTVAPVQFKPGGLLTNVVDANGNDVGGLEQNIIKNPAGAVEIDTSPRTAVNIDNSAVLEVDLSSATAATINDLRLAWVIQAWQERNARSGSRYTEFITAHFGLPPQDMRLDRPEFLGGGSAPISFSEVLQTSSTDATTPQANLAGHGVGVGQSKYIDYTAREHGCIIGLISIRPKTGYFQGTRKIFRKFDRFDYLTPSFAEIGEQPVYNYEIYDDPSDGQNNEVFGYMPIYTEYRHRNDVITGEFRTTQDFWTWARKFANRPLLNDQFIKCVPDDRIFAVQDGSDQFYVTVSNHMKVRHPLPYYGNPKSLI